MKIAGYLKTSLIEWPGKISSVIFTPGCNFRCPFCHNADLVLGRRFSQIPEERIYADLEKRKKWIDAVVVTGGEPTLQADLKKFLSELKKMEFLTMIHTNGTGPEILEDLIKNKLVDYIAMDIKGDLNNYEKYTGGQKSKVPPAPRLRRASKSQSVSWRTRIKSSMKLIAESGVEYEFRTTVVPTLHNLENLRILAEEIRTTVDRLQSTVDSRPKAIDSPQWFLQQFRPMNTLDKSYLKVKPYSKEEMENFQKELQKIIPQIFLRGI